MARYTIRVELFGDPSGEDYESLHTEMQRNKYFRVIQLGDDWYHLPNATYSCSVDGDSDDATTNAFADEVRKIAKEVWGDACVVVTQAAGARACRNLRKVGSANELAKLRSSNP